MYLCIDMGSTFTKVALYNKKLKQVYFWREKSIEPDIIKIASALTFEKTIISSTSPEIGISLVAAFQSRFKIDATLISSNIKLNFKINMPNPEELGADLIANSAAAVKYFNGHNTLVIDCGTATTMTIVDSDSIFQGGLIMPGLNALQMSFKNRFPELTQKLDAEKIAYLYPGNLLQNTTEGAVNAGLAAIFYGAIADNLTKFKSKYTNLKVIATGGNCHKCQIIKEIDLISPEFTFLGMLEIGAHS